MGSWAGIQKALNSTVGTANLKPLNEMIADVKATVIGQRTLAASNSVIKVLSAIPQVGTGVKIGQFTPKVNGSVRIKMIYSQSSNPNTVYLTVSANGVEIGKIYEITNTVSNKEMLIDVPVDAGVTYEVYGRGSDNITVHSGKVCANIVDTSLVE